MQLEHAWWDTVFLSPVLFLPPTLACYFQLRGPIGTCPDRAHCSGTANVIAKALELVCLREPDLFSIDLTI